MVHIPIKMLYLSMLLANVPNGTHARSTTDIQPDSPNTNISLDPSDTTRPLVDVDEDENRRTSIDRDTFVKGAFDVESSNQLSSLLKGGIMSESIDTSNENNLDSPSPSSFSLSLSLPTLTDDIDDSANIFDIPMSEMINYMFECTEGKSHADSPTSFFVCADSTFATRYRNRRKRHLQDSDSDVDTTPKAYLGVQGSFVTGVVEAGFARYEIKPHIVRDKDSGDMTDVTFEYAGALTKDLFYEHVGIPVESDFGEDLSLTVEEEPVAGEDGDGSRRSLRREEGKEDSGQMEMVHLSIEEHRERLHRQLNGDDGSEIDLLIYFTKRGACDWLGESYPCTLDSAAKSLLETYAEAWTQYLNQVLRNSDIHDLTYVKVGMAIDPSYNEGSFPSNSDSLNHLRTMDDGMLDDAHTLRDEYKADLVVGFTTGGGGVAYLLLSVPSPEWGFSITGGEYPFMNIVGVHEVGHNMGCKHHRTQGYYEGDPYGTDFSDINFGHASCNTSPCWTTVMSYRSVCSCPGGTYWIPQYSNPAVKYNGVKTGSNQNNNVEQISITKYGVALHRLRDLSIDYTGGIYDDDSLENLYFQVQAKQDITLTNFYPQLFSGARQIEISYARSSSYSGQEFNDAFWTTAANEMVTPLRDIIGTDKISADVAYFSSPFAIDVAAGETISIRMKMVGGNVRIGASGQSQGEVVKENDYLSLLSGKFGTNSFLYSNDAMFHGTMTFTSGDSSSLCDESQEDKVTIRIKTDNKGSEIYWFLKQYRAAQSKFFNVAKSGKGKYGNNEVYEEDYCVKKDKCMKFVIKDTAQDGLCCDHGEGSWKVSVNDVKLKGKNMKDRKKQAYAWGPCP